MPLPEAYEFYGTPRGRSAHLRQRVRGAVLGVQPAIRRAAQQVIDVPVLIVHSQRALAPDLAHAFYSAVQSPKRELWLDSQGQIDFYDDPKLIIPAADAVAVLYAEAW
jgi:hypothetical protein